MPMYVPEGQAIKRDPIKPGIYPAIIDLIADIGTPAGQKFGDKHQLVLRWQFPTLIYERQLDNGTVITGRSTKSRGYTYSVGKKSNLRRDIEQMTGKPFVAGKKFDIEQYLGLCCQVIIGNKMGDDGKADFIQGFQAWDEDQPKPTADPAPKMFGPGYSDEVVALPKWAQDAVTNQVNGLPWPPKGAPVPAEISDEIPF